MTIKTCLQHLCVASMALLLMACVTTVSRGHLKEDEAVSTVKVGSTTKDEVQKLFGSPSSVSSFGPPTWYYVSSVRQNRSILPVKVIDQHVVEIAFNTSGVVTAVKQYSLSDSKKVEIASDTTPTEGQKLGFFEQILSNLGRFNKQDGGRIGHRGGGTGPSGYPTR